MSRAASVCLGAQKHRGEALSSKITPQMKYRRSFFARQPSRSQFGVSFLRELRLALVSRLGSSKLWPRPPCFESYRKNAQKPVMRHLIVVLGLTSREHRGHFPPTAASTSCKENGRATRVWKVRGGKINSWYCSVRLLIDGTPHLYLDIAP